MLPRKSVRRVSVALAVVGLAAMGMPAQAGAAPPEPIDVTFAFPDPVAGFNSICSFPLTIDIEGKTKTITKPDGTVITTAPGQTATVTNLATGETLDLKIPGTGLTLTNGQFVFRGANLIIRSTVFGDNVNGLLFATGRYVFNPAAPEGTPRLTGNGRLTDICAALA